MNVLISVNHKFLDKAETMLFSLRLVVKDTIEVYLLNHSLRDEDISEFNRHMLLSCYDMAIHVIDVKSTALDQLPFGEGFSIETYYRLLAQFVLPSYLDRILWLDADLIIRKNITDFYKQPFDGKMYIVCPDARQESEDVKECKRRLSLPEDYLYFNAGVMLMNLEMLRKDTNLYSIVETCYMLRDISTYQDQDMLNYIYAGKVKYAEWEKYNYLLNGVYYLSKKEIKDICILHFAGKNKPWDHCQIFGVGKYWWIVRYKQGYRLEVLKAYLCTISSLPVHCFRRLNRKLAMKSQKGRRPGLQRSHSGTHLPQGAVSHRALEGREKRLNEKRGTI